MHGHKKDQPSLPPRAHLYASILPSLPRRYFTNILNHDKISNGFVHESVLSSEKDCALSFGKSNISLKISYILLVRPKKIEH